MKLVMKFIISIIKVENFCDANDADMIFFLAETKFALHFFVWRLLR